MSTNWLVCLVGLLRYGLSALFLGSLSFLALAGQDPFSSTTSGLKSDLISILTPVAAIAVIAAGVMAWFGKISWWWFTGVVFGTVLVFGSDQVVSWMRGLLGG